MANILIKEPANDLVSELLFLLLSAAQDGGLEGERECGDHCN
jgi:hypothetical protein